MSDPIKVFQSLSAAAQVALLKKLSGDAAVEEAVPVAPSASNSGSSVVPSASNSGSLVATSNVVQLTATASHAIGVPPDPATKADASDVPDPATKADASAVPDPATDSDTSRVAALATGSDAGSQANNSLDPATQTRSSLEPTTTSSSGGVTDSGEDTDLSSASAGPNMQIDVEVDPVAPDQALAASGGVEQVGGDNQDVDMIAPKVVDNPAPNDQSLLATPSLVTTSSVSATEIPPSQNIGHATRRPSPLPIHDVINQAFVANAAESYIPPSLSKDSVMFDPEATPKAKQGRQASQAATNKRKDRPNDNDDGESEVDAPDEQPKIVAKKTKGKQRVKSAPVVHNVDDDSDDPADSVVPSKGGLGSTIKGLHQIRLDALAKFPVLRDVPALQGASVVENYAGQKKRGTLNPPTPHYIFEGDDRCDFCRTTSGHTHCRVIGIKFLQAALVLAQDGVFPNNQNPSGYACETCRLGGKKKCTFAMERICKNAIQGKDTLGAAGGSTTDRSLASTSGRSTKPLIKSAGPVTKKAKLEVSLPASKASTSRITSNAPSAYAAPPSTTVPSPPTIVMDPTILAILTRIANSVDHGNTLLAAINNVVTRQSDVLGRQTALLASLVDNQAADQAGDQMDTTDSHSNDSNTNNNNNNDDEE